MLKTVIFDMDGVVIDSEPLHRKAYCAMFKDVGITVSDTLYSSFTGQSTWDICKQLCDYFHLKESPETLIALKRKYFKSIFETNAELTLIDGVLELIKHYHAQGLTLILASSAAMRTINQVFERFGLDYYFKTKLSGAELKASKPHPEIFLNAVQASGHAADSCMVIEDSTNGIKAAKAANIFCVGYDSFHSKDQDYSQADLVINDFKAITLDKIQPAYFL